MSLKNSRIIVIKIGSSLLVDNNKKIRPKVFYWNDNRKLMDQVEKIKGQIIIDGPFKRSQYHNSIKTIFKNKKDFYEKIWFQDDIEKLDKNNPGAGKRLKSIFSKI